MAPQDKESELDTVLACLRRSFLFLSTRCVQVAHGAGSGKKRKGFEAIFTGCNGDHTGRARWDLHIERRKSEGTEQETKKKNESTGPPPRNRNRP